MAISVGWASHVGLRRRLNEDAVLAESRLFVVADGMGGHNCGDVASALALEVFARLPHASALVPDDLVRAVTEANELIVSDAAHHPERAGMGTTLTALALVDIAGREHWALVNVGDSRAYRFAAGTLAQLTVDHSEVEELISAGRITEEQARVHPHRNIVTRSLGTDPGPLPDSWVFPVEGDEWFLLCSDGLTMELRDSAIADIIRDHPQPAPAAQALVDAALAGGGRDNISVVVVRSTTLAGTDDSAESTRPRPPIRLQETP